MNRRALSALSFLPLTLLGCAEDKEAPARVQGATTFQNTRWDTRTLSVCFETYSNSDFPLERGKSIMKQAVTEAYAEVGFAFTGWDTCVSGSPANIRVFVGPRGWPRVRAGIGKELNGAEAGLAMTFDFYSGVGWGKDCTDATRRENCIRTTALHEFGHAIGLLHEADRDDSTCLDKGPASVSNVGAYDPYSIMNYCQNRRQVEGNVRPTLSEGDKATIRHLYGM